MKIYKTHPWLVYLLLVIGVGLCGGLTWLAVNNYAENGDATEAGWLALLNVVITVFFGLGVWDGFQSYIMIEDDTITYRSLFSTRSLRLNEIKGHRDTDKYLEITPMPGCGKRIMINSYYKNLSELKEWVYMNTVDLNLLEAEESIDTIMNDESIGSNEEERMNYLLKVQRITKVLNWAGGISAAWFMFITEPYKLSLIACIVVFIIALITVFLYKGFIQLGQEDNSSYPSLFWAVFSTGMVMLIRVLTDYTLLEYNMIWIFVLPAVAVLTFLTLRTLKSPGKGIGTIFFYAIFFALTYTASLFGIIIGVNCTFDNSEPDWYTTTVNDKHETHGKHTSYNLELNPWGPVKTVESIEVRRVQYERINPGDKIEVYTRQGFLHLTWYDVYIETPEDK